MIYEKNYEEKQGGRIKMCLANLRKGKKQRGREDGKRREGETMRENGGGGISLIRTIMDGRYIC
jgi:hypothetical protein